MIIDIYNLGLNSIMKNQIVHIELQKLHNEGLNWKYVMERPKKYIMKMTLLILLPLLMAGTTTTTTTTTPTLLVCYSLMLLQRGVHMTSCLYMFGAYGYIQLPSKKLTLYDPQQRELDACTNRI